MHKEAFDSIYNIQSLVPEVFDMDDEKFKNVMLKSIQIYTWNSLTF